MDKKTINILNIYSDKIRKTMNNIIEEIDGDFTDWCELASMLMYRVVKENLPQIKDNIIADGKFNENGHYWNVIDGITVDLTIDQFGNYKTGIVDKKWLNKYNKIKNKTINEMDIKNMTDEFIDFVDIGYLV